MELPQPNNTALTRSPWVLRPEPEVLSIGSSERSGREVVRYRIARTAVWTFYELVARQLPTWMPGARSLRAYCAEVICEEVHLPVTINAHVSLPRRLRMASYAGIGEDTVFLGAGTVTLGPHLTMGPQCMFITGDHPVPDSGQTFRDFSPSQADIVVEEDVFMGARVTVLPGVTIGKGAAVGAGSVVAKDVVAGTTVVGNPARPVRHRSVES